MPPFLAELLGTMLLIVLGDGVVANVVLNKTKGQNAGWIVITAGWGFAVTVAVYAVASFSGAHLNPAVTIGLASIGKFAWAKVPVYIAAQLLGALLGAAIVWLAYLPHWPVTESPAAKLAVFCTAPAIRKTTASLLTEVIGTFVLVLGVLAVLTPKNLNPAYGWDGGFWPCLGGSVVASAQKEFRQIFPRPGWVEHDATEIWATQLHTATEALGKAGLTAADIAAVGITNQRETTVVWDRETGEPVHHAIVWQDRRTAAACDRLKARGLAPLIKRKTGLVVDAYFSATKLE